MRSDRFTKRRLRQERGVPLYRAVDIESRVFEAWAPHATLPHVERGALTRRPDGTSAPFVVPFVVPLVELPRDA